MTSPTKPGFLGITTVTKKAAEKTIAAPIISRRTDNQRLITWRGGRETVIKVTRSCYDRAMMAATRVV